MEGTAATILLVTLATLLVVSYLLWVSARRQAHSFFRRFGIDGPQPDLVWGNWMQLKKDRIAVTEEWIAEYGKVFGFYKGTVPYLVIGDVDMIKECFIKESSVFYNRPRAAFPVKPYNQMLLFLKGRYDWFISPHLQTLTSTDQYQRRTAAELEVRACNLAMAAAFFADISVEVTVISNMTCPADDPHGQEWKHVRTVLNPSFSAAKMKLMTPIISRCVDDFMDVLDQKADRGETVDVMQASQGLSLDVIANCALAWQLDGQKKPDNPLAQLLRGILYEAETAFAASFVAFPVLGQFASWLYSATLHYRRTWEIIDNVRRVVQARRRSQKASTAADTGGGGRRVDILQLLLDAQDQGNDASAEPTPAALAPIDDDTLLANSLLFLLAGFETTASTLSFILHLMAQHPLEQNKVYEELTKKYPADEDLDYGQLQELERLDMFVKESLRLYPPVVLLVSRHCSVDTTILGQFIPAGCEVLAPVWHLHHDPQLWSDPFRFKPERFAPEASKNIHPGAYMPFGIGPKSCIGNRFATLELKAALCKLLRRYQVVACSRVEDPIELVVQTVMVSPKTPIQVRLRHRTTPATGTSS